MLVVKVICEKESYFFILLASEIVKVISLLDQQKQNVSFSSFSFQSAVVKIRFGCISHACRKATCGKEIEF
jgi:hypothetical protein